jgi:hypothetical protein
MSKRRFNDLERELNAYLIGGGQVANIPSERLKKYAEWKFNVGGNRRRLEAESVRQRSDLKYAIIKPFGREDK